MGAEKKAGKKPKDKSKDSSAEVSRRRVRAAPVRLWRPNHIHSCLTAAHHD